MAKSKKNETQPEPLFPWSILFSRSGQLPAEPDGSEAPALGEKKRPMTEKEGRAAFVLWIVCGLMLCILVALYAVSCTQGTAPDGESSRSGLWAAAGALTVIIILVVAAFDFRKAWKAQNKKAGKKPAEKK